MKADQVTSLLATITLIELMFAIGLTITLQETFEVLRKRRLLLQMILANYVVAPALAVGLLVWLHTPSMVSVGILIAAVCPGAPYGPPFTAMIKGSVGVAVGLMAALAASSALLAPLLLRLLLPLVARDAAIEVDVFKMVSTLVLSQFLPLCAGIWFRRQLPGLACRLVKPARQISVVLNLLLFGLILTLQFQILLKIRLVGYAGMLILLAATFAAGWFLGGKAAPERKAGAMATAVRNVGVGLVIATSSFAGTPALSSITAYALVQTILIAVVAVIWGRRLARAASPAELAVATNR